MSRLPALGSEPKAGAAGVSRRACLGLIAGAGAAACTPFPPATQQSPKPADASLAALARAKGLGFGSAISFRQLGDVKYTGIVRAECGVIVAENAHKMYTIEPQPDVWNFAPGDAIAGFAADNHLGLRGHNLVWHHPRWLPAWVEQQSFASAAEAEKLIGGYITRVAKHYAPQVYAWDVVNETIDPATGALRETSLSRAMGPKLIDFCFHAAKRAAPHARLAYNDYMIWGENDERHRAGVLRLLERLRAGGVPIDALGVQSHLSAAPDDAFTPARQRAWRSFCDQVAAMGLEIYLTELDVNDGKLEGDVAARDAAVASVTKDYLDLMLSYPETKDVLVWGLVDSQSWLQGQTPRADGTPRRPTLYDADYQPKPMREAVAQALAAAPMR